MIAATLAGLALALLTGECWGPLLILGAGFGLALTWDWVR